MKKHLKLIDGTSNKFWQIETIGNSFTVTYGKNGTSGTTQTKTFENEAQCLKEAEKLLAEKVKKGYSEDGTSGVVATVAKPKVEAEEVPQVLFDEFDEIMATSNIEALLPFFQKHLDNNKEAWRKHIISAKKYWLEEYVDLNLYPQYRRPYDDSSTWGRRANIKQEKMIAICCVAALKFKEMNNWDELFKYFNHHDYYFMNSKEIELYKSDEFFFSALEIYKPDWVTPYLLRTVRTARRWQMIRYVRLREMEARGVIQYEPELYAFSLANSDKHRDDEAIGVRYASVEDEQFIQRDISLMFTYEIPLDQFTSNNRIWQSIFEVLIEKQKISRTWLLENCLLTQTKEWRLSLKSFFRNFIENIAFTNSDILAVQHTIFPLLQNPLVPVVYQAIDLIKKVVEEKDFDTNAFLDWIEPMMIRTDCKGGIKILLPMLEKIATRQSEYRSKVSVLLADVLMIPDLSLQERISKSILKIADKNDADLKEKLTMYASQMLGNVSVVLADFIDSTQTFEMFEEGITYTFNPQKPNVLLEENRVQLPETWNDILFQFGKFISSEEVIDTEILINSFLVQRDLFPEDYLKKLQPYFKKLSKLIPNGAYKNDLRYFLIAYFDKNESTDMKRAITDYVTFPYKVLQSQLLGLMKEKLDNQSNLPMLSFPTHTPHWIEPKILIERILVYQANNELIDYLDFSFALSRMPRENIAEALKLCQHLPQEIAEIITFCLGVHKNISIKGSDFTPSLFKKLEEKDSFNAIWATIARIHYPNDLFKEFGTTSLKDTPNVIEPLALETEFKQRLASWYERKDDKTGEVVRHNNYISILTQELPKVREMPSNLLYSLHCFSTTDYRWTYYLSSGYVQYWHSIMPQNAEPLVNAILENCCNTLKIGEDNTLLGFLKIAQTTNFHFSESVLMILTACIFLDKKEVRAIASDVLMQKIENKAIDVNVLSQKIAFLINNDYGAVSRVLDTFMLIKDISSLHNSALFILLENLVQHLDLDKKIPNNFKKLLELYYDLLVKMKLKPAEIVIEKLTPLKDNGSLKSIIKQITTA